MAACMHAFDVGVYILPLFNVHDMQSCVLPTDSFIIIVVNIIW
jgi:hypothetical protein